MYLIVISITRSTSLSMYIEAERQDSSSFLASLPL